MAGTRKCWKSSVSKRQDQKDGRARERFRRRREGRSRAQEGRSQRKGREATGHPEGEGCGGHGQSLGELELAD